MMQWEFIRVLNEGEQASFNFTKGAPQFDGLRLVLQ
jgi:hypothetical protein